MSRTAVAVPTWAGQWQAAPLDHVRAVGHGSFSWGLPCWFRYTSAKRASR